MMLYVGKISNYRRKQVRKIRSSWSYMFQIEECQVKIQYKSHLIEFQHHIEEVQRFFINQVKFILGGEKMFISLLLDRGF
jgi:hypothetical protein